MRRAREEVWYLALAALVTALSAARFLVPALQRTHGEWSAPLDDTFIHFDFARAAVEGHPFAWISGQGFSSGETAPLYAFVLAIGYAIGFRGMGLCAWALLVAYASVVSMMMSARRLVPANTALLVPIVLVSIGIVDFFYWSGMEVAFFGAVFGRALLALHRLRFLSGNEDSRVKGERYLGAWCLALVWIRPEAAACVYVFAIAAARGIGRRPVLTSLFRTGAPAALGVLAILAMNRLGSGDAASAGARLKLLSSNPYLSDVDRAREFALNIGHFFGYVLRTKAFVWSYGWPLLLLLSAVGLLSRRRRSLVATCISSAFLFALLTSWNGAARYQNFRYYAPALIMLLFGAIVGASSAKRPQRRLTVGALSVLALLGIARISIEANLFERAWSNIHDQQLALGKHLRASLPRDSIVLLGDAGAIPYASRLRAVDALGLGAYHGVPFTKAAPHGEAAMLELVERLPVSLRPTHFALYPNWFPETTRLFGIELTRFALDDNVICGGPTKILYTANFDGMQSADSQRAGSADELDTADVVSEEAHQYVSPAPEGGFTRVARRPNGAGVPVFDSCRVVPDGKRETFVANADARAVDVRLAGLAHSLFVEGPSGARAEFAVGTDGDWTTAHAEISIHRGDSIALVAVDGEFIDCHVWLR